MHCSLLSFPLPVADRRRAIEAAAAAAAAAAALTIGREQRTEQGNGPNALSLSVDVRKEKMLGRLLARMQPKRQVPCSSLCV